MSEGNVVNLGPVRLRKYAEEHHCSIIVIDEVHRESRDRKGKFLSLTTLLNIASSFSSRMPMIFTRSGAERAK